MSGNKRIYPETSRKRFDLVELVFYDSILYWFPRLGYHMQADLGKSSCVYGVFYLVGPYRSCLMLDRLFPYMEYPMHSYDWSN